jgi:hypothetical protein
MDKAIAEKLGELPVRGPVFEARTGLFIFKFLVDLSTTCVFFADRDLFPSGNCD